MAATQAWYGTSEVDVAARTGFANVSQACKWLRDNEFDQSLGLDQSFLVTINGKKVVVHMDSRSRYIMDEQV